MRRWPLILFVLLPGLAAILVCGYYLSRDWSLLIAAYARFQGEARGGADLRQLLTLQTYEQGYRINCFADGVGVMLGLVVVAIAVHGFSAAPQMAARREGL